MAAQLSPGTLVVTGAEVSSGAGAVFRIDPVKGTEAKLSSAGDLTTPIGVAIEDGGNVLIADADAFGGRGGVIRLDPVKKKQATLASGGLFANPFDVAIDPAGSILVADPHASRCRRRRPGQPCDR